MGPWYWKRRRNDAKVAAEAAAAHAYADSGAQSGNEAGAANPSPETTSASQPPQTPVQTPAQSQVHPRHKQAYQLWHLRGLALQDIRIQMRPSEPLAASTVV
jgi:hypothetical protein